MAQYIPIRWGSMNTYRRQQAEALMQTSGCKAVFGEHLEWRHGDTGGLQPTGMYLADGRGLVLQAVGNPAVVTEGLAGLVYAAKPGKDALALKTHIVLDQATQIGQALREDPDALRFDRLVVPVRMEVMFGPFRRAADGAVDMLRGVEALGFEDFDVPMDWLEADREAARGCLILYRSISAKQACALTARLEAVAPCPAPMARSGHPNEIARASRRATSIISLGKPLVTERQIEAAVKGTIVGHEVSAAVRRTTKFHVPD